MLLVKMMLKCLEMFYGENENYIILCLKLRICGF